MWFNGVMKTAILVKVITVISYKGVIIEIYCFYDPIFLHKDISRYKYNLFILKLKQNMKVTRVSDSLRLQLRIR